MEEIVLPENPDLLITDFFKKFESYTNDEKEKIKDAWAYLLEKTSVNTRQKGEQK